jgi:replication factor A1
VGVRIILSKLVIVFYHNVLQGALKHLYNSLKNNAFKEHIRGRPKGRSNLYKNLLKSIVLIARKHDFNPILLIEAIVQAWKNKTYSKNGLKIVLRHLDQDLATFLFYKEGKIISQFPIKLEILQTHDLARMLKLNIQSIKTSKFAKRKPTQKHKKIGELRFGMKGVNVKAKIIDTTPKKLVITRFGTQSYVSNVTIADETGTIKLSLWNNQIDKVHIDDEVEIKNGYVSSFSGEPQLRIGRKGAISTINPAPAVT